MRAPYCLVFTLYVHKRMHLSHFDESNSLNFDWLYIKKVLAFCIQNKYHKISYKIYFDNKFIEDINDKLFTINLIKLELIYRHGAINCILLWMEWVFSMISLTTFFLKEIPFWISSSSCSVQIDDFLWFQYDSNFYVWPFFKSHYFFYSMVFKFFPNGKFEISLVKQYFAIKSFHHIVHIK
jgi:hypothetical protein